MLLLHFFLPVPTLSFRASALSSLSPTSPVPTSPVPRDQQAQL